MEAGSLSKTAQQQHIAISAISKRLTALEAQLGCRLFRRHADGLEPTPAAAVLLRHAQTVLRNVVQLRIEMAELSEAVHGSVTIAASTAIAANYLPEELRSFSVIHPGVAIVVRDALSREAVQLASQGSVDFAIFADPYSPGTLDTTPYKTERLVAMLPAGHPLAAHRTLTLQEMLPFDFVGGRAGSSLNTLIEQAAAAAKLPLRWRVQVAGVDTIARMVEAGHGVAILPAALARPRRAGGMVARVLREPWSSRQLSLCHHPEASMTKPAQLLLKHLSGFHRTVDL